MKSASFAVVGQKNSRQDRVFIRIICVYSARKNMANGPAAYSTLNPDTSSDSPSVRSNGARFVSARVEIYHIIIRGHVCVTNHADSCAVKNILRLKPPVVITAEIMMRPNETS